MKVTTNLTKIFDRNKVADEIRHFVQNAEVMKGSSSFHSNQKNLTEKVSRGRCMYEWQSKGKEAVLIMSQKHAEALLDTLAIPLVTNRMQYPTKEFEQARSGEIALGMTKENSDMVVMINKQLVIESIDPVANHERNIQIVLERLQNFMSERGYSLEEMMKIIDKLEEDYPKTDNSELNHD